MISQLRRWCPGDHAHQQLDGNWAKDAESHPVPLVRAILKGISMQAVETAQTQKLRKDEIENVFSIKKPSMVVR